MGRREETSVSKRFEYNVQATNGTEHPFPQIAQGLSQAEKERMTHRADREANP